LLGEDATREVERALAGAPQASDPDFAALEARRPFDALAIAERRLAHAPGDRAARRLRILALEQAGAPALALEDARRHPGLVDAAVIARLEGGAAAFLVRWGAVSPALPPEDPTHRFAATDRALAALDAAIAAWEGRPEAASARRTARLDRLIALRDRRRMAEVIAEAEALAAEAPLPGYVRGAIGDARLTLRQPEAAEHDFRAALEAEPGAVQPSLGLFYALVEQRRWAEAEALVDGLDAATPAFRATRGEAGEVADWQKLDTAWAAALHRLFADDLPGAEARAEALVRAAPANTTLRTLRADIWRARGLPGAALEEAEAALSLEPLSLGLRLSRAEALMDLRIWREAEEMILPLARDYPENTAVRRLARRWALHNRWELEAEARSGLERGNAEPEFTLAARLYSPPIAHDWRLFVGSGLRRGDTPEGRESIARGLLGLEYRIPALVLRVAGTYDANGVSRGGALAEGVLRLSDQWRIEASGETLAFDTPLRALRNGITAGGGGAALVWRDSERREAGAQLRVLRFSDDNVRTIGFARWTERVLSQPDWRLDLTPYAYATENSRPGGPYFAPRRDLETGVTAQLSWVAWRRYERDLVVVGQATAAGYWQEDFGWSPLLALRWENRQSLSDAAYIAYGAGWTRRDYDGVVKDAVSFTAALRWRM
ncbi:poly-beta-1,6 N-acetyl-D-glucosamine export porin PgaA, partial [Falsiroseomonas oryziterrae]|uniref:poly-beta-1,6 N-acetyl-D-glucosamine export porin PgaA n=1 Tax=Falsiroseomonas oryziterrae TaxID=2911368 RepID=UPI001F00D1EE